MNQFYYLKCSNCGYLTKIENENHNYCWNCTQIFSNCFKKWKLQNEGGKLEEYKRLVCEKYSEYEVKDYVNPRNRKVEIKKPNGDQIKRRRYIEEGVPLDRGGFTEWDMNQAIKHYVLLVIIIVILVLLMIFMD